MIIGKVITIVMIIQTSESVIHWCHWFSITFFFQIHYIITDIISDVVDISLYFLIL